MADFPHKTPQKAVSVLLAWSLLASAMPSPALARSVNDPYFDELWNLQKINAPTAWDASLGFEGIPIAIIDSGVDVNHPDLKDNIWRNVNEIPGNGIDDDGNGYVDDVHGWDFVDNDNDPRPDVSGGYTVVGANHGTVDAGIAAARGDNGKGIVGVTWQASIMPLRVLDSNGSGNPRDVVRAVEYAVHNGARVINMSFAGPSYNQELAIALRNAYDAGVFIVAAAGNAPNGDDAVDLDQRPLYPVCFDSGSDENFIYGVAATDADDRRASFSNYGAGCTDISAPGTRMISTQLYLPGTADFDRPYGGYYNGTSLAAAEVSGVVALVLALDRRLTPKQVANILIESSAKIDDQNPGLFGKIGRGRLDAAAAVARVTERTRQTVLSPVTTSSLLPKGASTRLVVAAPGPVASPSVLALRAGRAPEVRLFTEDGTFIRSFTAYPDGFRGGMTLATANFDGTGRHSIVTGAGPGGSPQVRIFDSNTRVLGSFMAYDTRFAGGVNVAAGDLDGDGIDEIVTGAGPGGGPHVRIFSANGMSVGGFFAGDSALRKGVEVRVADADGDGKNEILAHVPGAATWVAWSPSGKVRMAAVSAATATAARPAAPGARTAIAAARGQTPLVGVADAAGKVLFRFQTFENSYKGGVSAAITE